VPAKQILFIASSCWALTHISWT